MKQVITNPFIILEKVWGNSFHLVFALCLFLLSLSPSFTPSSMYYLIVTFENFNVIGIWQIYSIVQYIDISIGQVKRSEGKKHQDKAFLV